MPTITAMMITAATVPTAMDLPMTNCWNRLVISCGILEIMLMIRTMEMPLPTPLSVICSPIHIRNALPAVRAAITRITLMALNVSRSPCLPKPIAMALLSISASPIVT